MEITSAISFENILLSSRNQLLLKKSAIEICREKNLPFPQTIVHYLLYFSIKYLESHVKTHKFSNQKLSWLNTQILIKFYEDVENHLVKKSYWLKAELEKNVRIEKQKNVLAAEKAEIIKIEKMKDEILNKNKKIQDPFKKKLNDLYNYA
jgi:hypothetical protein